MVQNQDCREKEKKSWVFQSTIWGGEARDVMLRWLHHAWFLEHTHIPAKILSQVIAHNRGQRKGAEPTAFDSAAPASWPMQIPLLSTV